MSNHDIELDYEYMMQQALLHIIKNVLTITQELGHTPGEHHFYISFNTKAPGVQLSDKLRETYPNDMTIVLQHRFQNLNVYDDHFEVTLEFDRIPNTLSIPFNAIIAFMDPSTEFSLQFDTASTTQSDIPDTDVQTEKTAPTHQGDAPSENSADGADIVSLDTFRKK